MQVRRARPSDVAGLGIMMAAMHDHEGIPTAPWSHQALAELVEAPGLGRVLVAESDGLVGYALVGFGYSVEFAGRDAFLDELFVVVHERGRGIARRLMEAAEEECRQAGIKAIHLEVDHANPGARNMYESQGYAAHPRHLMTKWLAAPGLNAR